MNEIYPAIIWGALLPIFGHLCFLVSKDILPEAIRSFRGPLIRDFYEGVFHLSFVLAIYAAGVVALAQFVVAIVRLV